MVTHVSSSGRVLVMRVVNLTIGVSGSALVKRVVIRFRHDRSVFLVIERGKRLIGARFREF